MAKSKSTKEGKSRKLEEKAAKKIGGK